jgi:DNA-binding XRE family transcriptional regulator
MLTTFQIRTARAGCRKSLDIVAKQSGISKSTLIKMESLDDRAIPNSLAANLAKLKAYFENEGIEFIGQDSIRLRTNN